MAKNNLIQVGGELKSIAYDGIVVDAKAVYDYTLDETQEDINQKTNSLQKIAGNYTTESMPTMISTQGGNYSAYFANFADYFTLYPGESIEVNSSNSSSTVYIVDRETKVHPVTGVEHDVVLASGTGEATYQNDTNNIKEVKVALSTASTEYDYTISTSGVPKEALRSDVQDTLEDVSGKQDVLVSGTNIKTINNQSLLGSGNITIEVDGSDDGITEAYTVVDAGTLTKVVGSSHYNISNTVITAINNAYNSGRIPILIAVLGSDSNIEFTSIISKSSDNKFYGEFHTSSNRYYFSSLTYSQLATGAISSEVNVNESSLKTVNGNSLLGEGNVSVGTYTKPSGGIPTSDLASAIQTSLGKADTSYQKPSGGIPTSDMATSVQTSIDKAESAVQYEESTNSYSGTTDTSITINGNTYYTTDTIYTLNPGDEIRYTCQTSNHATYIINAGVTPKTLLQESNSGDVYYTNETNSVIQVQGACISNNDSFYVQIIKPGLVSLQNTKVSKMPFTSLNGSQISTLSTQINRLYYINNVSTLTITLPGVSGTDTNYVQNIEFIVETASSGSTMVNFSPTNSVKIMGYESLTNATTYRFSAMCVANVWYITMNIIDAPTK